MKKKRKSLCLFWLYFWFNLNLSCSLKMTKRDNWLLFVSKQLPRIFSGLSGFEPPSKLSQKPTGNLGFFSFTNNSTDPRSVILFLQTSANIVTPQFSQCHQSQLQRDRATIAYSSRFRKVSYQAMRSRIVNN